jgi:hypothetical protein
MNNPDNDKPKNVLVFRSGRPSMLLGFALDRSDLPDEYGPWLNPPGLSMMVYRNYPREDLRDSEILKQIEAHRFCLLAEEEARTFIEEYIKNMRMYFDR